jgi:hypothetical protein
MGARSEELARQFEESNQEFIATVELISDEDWNNMCEGENWPVGVTAHHVAYDYPVLTDTMQALAAGESRPLTMEMINDLNAKHAQDHAVCSKEDTLRMLREEGARQAEAIRALEDEDLDRTHDLPLMGPEPVPLHQFISAILIRHHHMHLPSIRAAAPSARVVSAD